MANTPSLTAIMIMSLMSVFVIGFAFDIYTNWVVLNEGDIDPQYSFIYTQLASSYDDLITEAESLSQPEKAKSILEKIGDAATGTVNIFVIGLSSIGQFFSLVPLLTNLLELVRKVFPMIDALIGLIIVIMALYIAMRFIKSARGTTIEV